MLQDPFSHDEFTAGRVVLSTTRAFKGLALPSLTFFRKVHTSMKFYENYCNYVVIIEYWMPLYKMCHCRYNYEAESGFFFMCAFFIHKDSNIQRKENVDIVFFF